MVADTYSSTLGFLNQGTGNNNNAWGDNCDNNVFAVFERAIAGRANYSVTGGTLDLSGTPPPGAMRQDIDMMLAFFGTLTSTQYVIVPALPKIWLACNYCTGNFGVIFKTPAGAVLSNAPASCETWMWTDGGNVYRQNRNMVGEFVDTAMGAIPPGTLECNGQVVATADYPDLFNRIGALYGGNGTTNFAMPNLYSAGRFRRSRSPVMGYSGQQASAIASHSDSVTVSGTGTSGVESATHYHYTSGTTSDISANHTHDFRGEYDDGGGNSGPNGGGAAEYRPLTRTTTTESAGHTHTWGANSGTQSANHTHTTTITSTGGGTYTGDSETRPNSHSCIVCIRY